MTKGSYLTAALAGAETIINLKDTTDFPSSGNGWFIDTTNDRDAFSWTGKTATTLTGCTGVLAHNNGASVVPAVKGMIIDSPTNEMRFYGDRGDGTVEEVANIGLSQIGSDMFAGHFGSQDFERLALFGETKNAWAVWGKSVSSIGVYGQSSSYIGGYFITFGTGGGAAPLVLAPAASASAPTHTANLGSLWVTSAGVLYINTSNSTTWEKVGAQ